MTAHAMSGVDIGIYEKALKWDGSWANLFAQARRAGFAFVDLSVDETPEREARLRWKQVVDAGLKAVYWAQDGGRWVRKAESKG